jgi:hypothetical protein
MTQQHTRHAAQDGHRMRVRKRPLESTILSATKTTSSSSPKCLTLIIATLLSATTILSPVADVHALISPSLQQQQRRRRQQSSTQQLHSIIPSSSSSEISRGGAAAAAGWLFTPDRTASALADTVGDAAISTASAVADVALEAAAYAADTAATVTTETVVQTIYKAPFLSLAISFILGGLLFSTVAAFVAATYSFGKENSRRLREVVRILMRRNWTVIRMQWVFTLVSEKEREREAVVFVLVCVSKEYTQLVLIDCFLFYMYCISPTNVVLFIPSIIFKSLSLSLSLRTSSEAKKRLADSKTDSPQHSKHSKMDSPKLNVSSQKVSTPLRKKHKCIRQQWDYQD